MSRRTLLIGLVVLVLALGSSWLSQRSDITAPISDEQRATPDYFIVNFTATEMDETGRPLHRLEALRLTHYPDSEITELQQPHFIVFRAGSLPWHLFADSGIVEKDGDLVRLQGGVRVVRPGPDALEMLTDSLRLYPDRKYAETDDPLRMTQALTTVEAVGMQAHIEEQRVLLLSEVRGVHEP